MYTLSFHCNNNGTDQRSHRQPMNIKQSVAFNNAKPFSSKHNIVHTYVRLFDDIKKWHILSCRYETVVRKKNAVPFDGEFPKKNYIIHYSCLYYILVYTILKCETLINDF